MNIPIKHQNISPAVSDFYEIICAYFVDFYYNDLYNKSLIAIENGEPSNLTQLYVKKIDEYTLSVDKNMRIIIKFLHMYYQKQTSTCGINEFEAKFLTYFIPEEFLVVLSSAERGSNFASIITKIIKIFSETLKKKYLPMIIDKHNEKTNVRVLQDMLFEKLLLIRQEYHKHLMAAEKNLSKDNTQVQNELKKSVLLINKLANELNIQKNENIKLKQELENLKKKTAFYKPNNVISSNTQNKQPNVLNDANILENTVSKNTEKTNNLNQEEVIESKPSANSIMNLVSEPDEPDVIDELEETDEPEETDGEDDGDDEEDLKKRRMEKMKLLKLSKTAF